MTENQIIRNCNKCRKLIKPNKEVYSNPENLWWHLDCLKKVSDKKVDSEKIKSDVERGKSLLLELITNSSKKPSNQNYK